LLIFKIKISDEKIIFSLILIKDYNFFKLFIKGERRRNTANRVEPLQTMVNRCKRRLAVRHGSLTIATVRSGSPTFAYG
jgi:hypothetical protein